jgi:hypothetical protein
MFSTLASTLFRNCRARTRDLCPNSEPKTRNLLESGGTDGHPKHPEEPLETLIAPVTHPGPLP